MPTGGASPPRRRSDTDPMESNESAPRLGAGRTTSEQDPDRAVGVTSFRLPVREWLTGRSSPAVPFGARRGPAARTSTSIIPTKYFSLPGESLTGCLHHRLGAKAPQGGRLSLFRWGPARRGA